VILGIKNPMFIFGGGYFKDFVGNITSILRPWL
jgi:hypothetical protein